ncbi:hypothetical protein EMCRGX_G022729 [Ephydatia muelleri]
MCSGTVANRNKLWFTELSDKMKSTKTHLYWCMKNCTGNADDLHVMIMNISRHYQRKLLSDPAAIRALEGALTRTSIYRYAAHYCRSRDTYWIESFNHQLLTYLSKRVHFGDDTFVIRMNLAVLDWNENVQRAATSHRVYLNAPEARPSSTISVVQGDEEEEGSNDDGFFVPGLEDGDFVDDDDDDNDDADDIVEDEM